VAAPMTIKITGIEATFARLKSKVNEIKAEIDNEMAAAMEMMATSAKQKFPSAPNQDEADEYSRIKASIRVKKIQDLSYMLLAGYGDDPQNPNHAMAAYIEFGTGPKFKQYPGKEAEWQNLAKQYEKTGKGWMTPAPYFYPSVTEGYQKLFATIKNIVQKNERL